MSTTAQLLITGALLDLNILASGETPAPEESADGLIVLNQLISSWNAQALPIFQISRDAFSLTGAQSYTVGPSMVFNTTRPVKIEAAAVITASGVGRPCRIATSEEWTAYLDKAATGNFAEILYYDHGYPTGTLWLAPKPTGGTLELFSYKPLAQLASLTSAVDFPDGYERALRSGLAMDLAVMFGRPLPPGLPEKAADAKMAIAGLNQAILGRPNQAEPQQQPQAA